MNNPHPEPTWIHREATVNGVRLHYVEAGQDAGRGPLVILLHGFPEFWYSWRHQITALAAAGCHVIAPDMRGYNTSGKPAGVGNYDIDALSDDVAALISHAGADRAVVAGHDWGGIIAWWVALRHPDRVEKLIILNAPHPAAALRELRKPSQLMRSWYIFFFQLPWLPEWSIRANHYAMLRAILRRDPVNRRAFTGRDIRRYIAAIAQPGALTSTINYYRAAFRRGPRGVRQHLHRIAAPTLIIWGERDRYMEDGMLDGLDRWVNRLRITRLPHASHWVQNDAPQEVNRLMVEFIEHGSD